MAMNETAKQLPKRFYDKAGVTEAEGAFQVTLDGRPAITPARHKLASIHKPLADAIAEEWDAQEEVINPYAMPLTQRRMLIIDRGKEDREKWVEGIRKYLQSDLLCYRAGAPEELVQRQTRVWDAYISWAKDTLSIPLKTTTGVLSINQPPEAEMGLNAQLAEMDEEVLCCLAAATEITGSAVLALALAYKAAEPEDVFEVSRLDEKFQAEKWGEDAEAIAREEAMQEDFMAIARYLELIGGEEE